MIIAVGAIVVGAALIGAALAAVERRNRKEEPEPGGRPLSVAAYLAISDETHYWPNHPDDEVEEWGRAYLNRWHNDFEEE